MLWNSGEELSPTIDADLTTVAIVSSTEDVSGLKMCGNYTPEMDMKDKWGIVKKESVWKVMKGSEGAKLKPFCAYFEYNKGVGSRGFSIGTDDGTTSINSTLYQVEPSDNQYYNLQGMPVTNPTKGLYILNGKKVIIR